MATMASQYFPGLPRSFPKHARVAGWFFQSQGSICSRAICCGPYTATTLQEPRVSQLLPRLLSFSCAVSLTHPRRILVKVAIDALRKS